LRRLPVSSDPNVLVGFATSDDAGVYQLRDDLALVQTVDFFTPIVDDPYDFGRIAAANAISDVYAMGGTPLTALNIAAFPVERLGTEILARILEGGLAVAKAAGVAILGGHTIEDDEPKYGLAVTGTIDPRRVVTNAGAQPGDVLLLTKPLGTGILASALKKGALDEAALTEAVSWMTMLNGPAARAMLAAGVHAATDVTGYGLLGHAGEMMRAGGVRLRLSASAVPVLPHVRDMLAAGIAPGGTRENARQHAAFTEFAPGIDDAMRAILSDAQTSGGLLIAVPRNNAAALKAALVSTGSLGAEIGRVEAGTGIAVAD
jgi:selenide,water dikinase